MGRSKSKRSRSESSAAPAAAVAPEVHEEVEAEPVEAAPAPVEVGGDATALANMFALSGSVFGKKASYARAEAAAPAKQEEKKQEKEKKVEAKTGKKKDKKKAKQQEVEQQQQPPVDEAATEKKSKKKDKKKTKQQEVKQEQPPVEEVPTEKKGKKNAKKQQQQPVEEEETEEAAGPVADADDTEASDKKKDKKKNRKQKQKEKRKSALKPSAEKEEPEEAEDEGGETEGEADEAEAEASSEEEASAKPAAKEDKSVDEAKSRRTVFVGNVSLDATEKDVARHFAPCGKVETVRLRNLPVAGCAVDQAGNQKLMMKVCANKKIFNDRRETCNAYVVFASEDSVSAALALDGSTLLGKKLRVDRESLVVDPRRSVFVGNLAFQLPDDQLRAYFNAKLRTDEEREPVENVRIVRDRESGLGKGFGYVLLKTSALAAKALSLHETKLGTREIRVQVCGKRTKNRRGEESDPGKKHEGLRAAAGARARILLKRKSASDATSAKRQKLEGAVKTIKPKHAARKARQAAEAAAGKPSSGKPTSGKPMSGKRPRGDDKGDRSSTAKTRPAKKPKGKEPKGEKPKAQKPKAQKPKHAARKARQAAEAAAASS